MGIQSTRNNTRPSLYHRLLDSIDCRAFTLSILSALHILLLSSLILSIINAYYLAHISTSPFPTKSKNTSGLTSQNSLIYSSLPGFTCPPHCPGGSVCEFPHPTDCTRYISCSSNAPPISLGCPNGLHFQARSRQCTYPRQAGCRQCVASMLETKSRVELVVETLEGSNLLSGSEVSALKTRVGDEFEVARRVLESVTKRFVCPSGEGESVHANPVDCKSYIRCADFDGDTTTGRVATVIACEGQLEWNDWEKKCDYEFNSTCDTENH